MIIIHERNLFIVKHRNQINIFCLYGIVFDIQ